MNYRIFPPEGWLEAAAEVPGSKSVAARQCVISFLAGSDTDSVAADSDDVKALAGAVATLRAARPGETTYINIDGAGTAMRFLTAAIAATPGLDVTLDGNERMRERPISVLVEALRSLGAAVDYVEKPGFPPLRVKGRRLEGREVEIDATVSSQYVSALMMIAPLVGGMKIILAGDPVSMPYAVLTASVMTQAGADVEIYGGDTVEVRPGKYKNVKWEAEADWSSAAPWYVITALSGGEVAVKGLAEDSCQPDRRMVEIFHRLGVDTEFTDEGVVLTAHPDAHARLDLDATATPDAVPAIAVTCAMLGIPFTFTGIDTLRIKECDRVEALRAELLKVGVVVELPDAHTMSWDGRRLPVMEVPRFATYGDHRMAMALAPVALYIPGIVIENPEVVSKSYPDFWRQLAGAGFIIADADAPAPAQEGDAE